MAPVVVRLEGKRFGTFLVVSEAGRDKWGQALWLCQCDCGNGRTVTGGNLRHRGDKQSCGCAKAERFRKTYTKHGHTANHKVSREYRSWQGMKKRCLDTSHKWYKNYGGRGITICDNWLNSFETFLLDMGERPSKFTLDRIDVNGNYEPGNCRWASWQTQARNKRK